jgi:hypothetical protein
MEVARSSVQGGTGAGQNMKTGPKLLAGMAAVVCAACSHLPVGGPNHYDIEWGASESVTLNRREIVFDYVLLDINRNVLEHVYPVGPDSFFNSFDCCTAIWAAKRIAEWTRVNPAEAVNRSASPGAARGA